MPETDNQPTGLAQVLAYVDAHQQQFIDRLLAYVAQPSISAHGVGIRETADFLFSYLQDLGMETRLLGMEGEHAGWPFVYGRHRQRPQAPTALLYGHYDVQPPDPLDAWMSPPFEPEIRDGRIWGRGVGDNKGQHLAQLLAIESWLAVTGGLPCNVIVLLEGEEEIGSPHISDCVRAHRALLADADLVITADGPVHESGLPCIKFGPRGIASFELRVTHATAGLSLRQLGRRCAQSDLDPGASAGHDEEQPRRHHHRGILRQCRAAQRAGT